MLYRRPPRPDNFETTVAAEAARVRAAVERGEKPAIKKALWRNFKVEFSRAQRGRCGYCELPVIAGQFGDVEHFAPKNELREFGNWELERGAEVDMDAKLKNRKPSKSWAPGYWWLAYDWNNYLLACEICNTAWKGNLYPVKQPQARNLPSETAQEVPLLLNPYGKRDPKRHLTFAIDGSVAPYHNSPFGLETIRTCGLGRAGLVEVRKHVANKTFGAVNEARQELANGIKPEDSRGFRDLHQLGEAGAAFPGMVRAIMWQQIGVTWSELDELFGA
jgi:hypothetical protein